MQASAARGLGGRHTRTRDTSKAARQAFSQQCSWADTPRLARGGGLGGNLCQWTSPTMTVTVIVGDVDISRMNRLEFIIILSALRCHVIILLLLCCS